tara:strand:- start:164 stop:355 length:192 start_codon:yes stop_codon:yes gene_type:complete
MNNSTFLGSAHIDNGYNGHKIWVHYVSFDDVVYEIHPTGFHNIPVVSAMSRLIDQEKEWECAQ